NRLPTRRCRGYCGSRSRTCPAIPIAVSIRAKSALSLQIGSSHIHGGATGVALRVIWAMTILLPCGCALDGAPFPSFFKMTGPGQFEFVARGNWIYPANTTAGETERLTWLRGYVSEHHICPAGYTIIKRTRERATEPPGARRWGPPSDSRNDQLTGSVKY